MNIFQFLGKGILTSLNTIAHCKQKLCQRSVELYTLQLFQLRKYFQESRSNQMSITCPNCGHENQDDALYCDECGVELKADTLSSIEEETMSSEESYSEVAADDESFGEESYSEVAADDESFGEESYSEVTADEEEVDTTLQPEAEPALESAAIETEEPEQSPSGLPIGAATRLEIDEPPIEKIVAPATTLELPELPKAVLIDQETGEKFILPSEEKIIYIGRLNEEFPIQVDLSAIPNADLISRVHAAIHFENEVYYLEDAGSANGTWLNETKIESGTRFRQLLNPGDTIAFGRNQTVKFTFDLED